VVKRIGNFLLDFCKFVCHCEQNSHSNANPCFQVAQGNKESEPGNHDEESCRDKRLSQVEGEFPSGRHTKFQHSIIERCKSNVEMGNQIGNQILSG